MSSQSPSSTQDASATDTGSPSFDGQSSNYFFSFIIAFVVFLCIFLSLGVVARRRRLRFMRQFIAFDEEPEITQSEPSMVEPRYNAVSKPTFAEIMPLSASYTHRDVPIAPSKEEELNDEDDGRPPRLRNPFKRKPERIRRTTSQVTDGLSVVVMISMPLPPPRNADDEEPAFEIGSMHLPWKDNTIV